MSRLVLSETDGSDPLECQAIATYIWLDVVKGGRFSIPQTRGENIVYPSKVGQYAGAGVSDWFVADNLPVKVQGEIEGVGATAALRRASFATTMGALNSLLAYEGKVVRLVAHPPNEGLASGETATIDVQLMRLVRGNPRGWEADFVEIEFQCVSDPMGWTVA